MRTWIHKLRNDENYRCAVWVELGMGKYLWILNDGQYGVDCDMGSLLKDLTRKDGDWEEV